MNTVAQPVPVQEQTASASEQQSIAVQAEQFVGEGRESTDDYADDQCYFKREGARHRLDRELRERLEADRKARQDATEKVG